MRDAGPGVDLRSVPHPSTGRESSEGVAGRLFERLGPSMGLDCYLHYGIVAGAEDATWRLVDAAGLDPEQLGSIGTSRRMREVAVSGEPGLELKRHLGVSAFVCHPLLDPMDGGEVLGILSFGSWTRTGFTDAEVGLLRTASEVLAVAVGRDLLDERDGVIDRATGIVMERHRLSSQEAIDHLRRFADRHGVGLRTLSTHVVEASSGRARDCA